MTLPAPSQVFHTSHCGHFDTNSIRQAMEKAGRTSGEGFQEYEIGGNVKEKL
jgi:hypothetical protein